MTNKRLRLIIYSKIEFYPYAEEEKSKLEEYGYKCLLPLSDQYKYVLNGKNDNIDQKKASIVKRDDNLFKKEYEYVRDSDAILVLNYDWNNTKGYIGENMFLNIGFAYVLGKKIFILNSMSISQLNLKNDILIMNPIILRGNIDKIKNYLF